VLEKVAMDYAIEMTRTPVEVPDDLFRALSDRLDAGQLVELTYLIGWENFRARTNHALAIEAAGFSAGAACAVPLQAAQR
jgi:alkylhydroperoxidase family enzyme